MGSIKGATVKLDKSLCESRVLIVENDTRDRNLIYNIANTAGCLVEKVENGVLALPKLFKERYDLVISDISAPALSGMKLLEMIKKQFPATEVIMTTSNPKVEAAVEAMRIGALDYITKPFDIDHIKEKILSAVRTEDQNSKDFNFIRKLGQGSMGVVFLVEKENRQFALKIVKYSCPELVQRFLKEGKAMNSLKSKNIIKVYEYGFTHSGDTPYILMEYFEGKTLKEIFEKNTPFSLKRKVKVILKVAEALNEVHSKNIVHRDIKPENIMVGENDSVRLMDFGVCQVPDSDQTNLLSMIGSPYYQAPESYQTPKVSFKADIFSLGVVAYEFFLHTKAYDVKSCEGISELGMKVINENPVKPSSINKNFPYNLQKVLQKMLMKNPYKRYSTTLDLVNDLKDIVNEGFTNKKFFQTSRWNTL